MTKCSGSVNSIETLGLVDGPGVRVVVFLNGCTLRCKFCHNPETWNINRFNSTTEELVKKISRFKPYFKHGGVTFSGGEPLLQWRFLLPVFKALKEEKINIAVDTAGIVGKDFDYSLFDYVDTVLLDIKAVDEKKFKDLTGGNLADQIKFIERLNKYNVRVWIRQVIIPNYNDTIEYMDELLDYSKKIKQVEKIELLAYHKMAIDKYAKLGIEYPLVGVKEMDSTEVKILQEYVSKKI